MPDIKHILVFRLSAMGDVAMTVPVIRALVAQYPTIKVTVVSRPFFSPFFEGILNVDFFPIDLKERHKGFLGLYRLYRDLKMSNIDAVADLHNVLRSKVVRSFFALGGKKVAFVDKGRTEKKALTRAENKNFKPLIPMVIRYTRVFEQLGFPVDLQQPIFPLPQPLEAAVKAVTGEKSGKWIGIAPFAQYASKVYPQKLMQQVIGQLADNPEYKIFLFGGGAQEIAVLEQFAAGLTNVKVIAGILKLKQELQLISHLDVMLSMDSGNAHIAAMLGIKVITIWGATHPYAGFLPFNQPMDSAIVADRERYPLLPTSIYGNKQVEGYEAVMESISPSEVVKKIEKALG